MTMPDPAMSSQVGLVRWLTDVQQMLDSHSHRALRVSMDDIHLLSFEQIAALFGLLAAYPRRTIQLLTTRPERMARWFRWAEHQRRNEHAPPLAVQCGIHASNLGVDVDYLGLPDVWPLPNVWVGTPVVDQKTANERIPRLLRVPAAVRFLLCVSLSGPIDLSQWDLGRGKWWMARCCKCGYTASTKHFESYPTLEGDAGVGCPHCHSENNEDVSTIDRVILGDGHGPDVQSIRAHCTAAGVQIFCDQQMDGAQHVACPKAEL